MLNNKTIAVVIPAYNEEGQIRDVIHGLPDYIDKIVVVNDGSKDNTENVVLQLIKKDPIKITSTLRGIPSLR